MEFGEEPHWPNSENLIGFGPLGDFDFAGAAIKDVDRRDRGEVA